MSEHRSASPERGQLIGRALSRWLGVGLASALAVITVTLAVTGQLGLYINPDAAWWAVGMSVVLLVVAVASCTVPLQGDEHDHAHDAYHPPVANVAGFGVDHGSVKPERMDAARVLRPIATVAGGVVATGIIVSALILPPATLSTGLAMTRATETAPLFGGTSNAVALAATVDTASLGVAGWASVLASTTDPDSFVGVPATLEGFVGVQEDGEFGLARMFVTHCVIDAQTASVPVEGSAETEEGSWVRVEGTWARGEQGSLVLVPATVTAIDQPEDPYEF